jgi:hypothetical protein
MSQHLRVPTDLRILQAIYDRHYAEYAAFTNEKPNRGHKPFVPVDIHKIARDFKVDPEIVFGRLLYHLDHKYGYDDEKGSRTPFFTPWAGDDRNCVNFPYMASVLADLQEQSRKHNGAIWIAVASLLVSVASATISILSRMP